MITKEELRQRVREAEREMERGWVSEASRVIQHKVIESEAFERAQKIGCYLSWGKEVETMHLLQVALEKGKAVAAPKYFAEEGRWRHAILEVPQQPIADDRTQPGVRSQLG